MNDVNNKIEAGEIMQLIQAIVSIVLILGTWKLLGQVHI